MYRCLTRLLSLLLNHAKDWEYPGFVDHSGTPDDRENYTKLLQAIRYRLDNLTRQTGKTYGLTAALPCNPKHIDNLEVDKLANILTEFNLMSYDLFGSWDPVTGANAPLYHQGFGDEDFNIHSCVENYVALGAPRERMNIGLPFYGRSFKGATGPNQPHGGNDEANWPDDEGTPQYFNIYQKLPYMIQVRDNIGKTQYAYTKRGDPKLPPGGEMLPEGLVSFDDERAICDKVHYAQTNDLGGFIVWELSGDILEDLRTPLLDITNKKLANPSFQCCMLHSIDECEKERLEEEKRQQQQQQYQNQGGYSNSFGFDTSTWGGNESIRMQNGSSILSLSIVSTIVIGCVSVLTTIWL
jgi:chitinase